jgi:stage IV sporulation protein FB
MSCLVAVQHECAHAFAAARLGYKLNKIVLMPFGALIDGDLKGIGVKDELFVAICGPLCNLATAFLFAAIWWFAPTMYAFTDTAYYSSLAVALVNLLPAYPLDGGRILKCLIENSLRKSRRFSIGAEERAQKICRAITLVFALLCFVLFLFSYQNIGASVWSIFTFSLFLAFSAFRNKRNPSLYEKLDFSDLDALKRGVEIRKVAVLSSCPVKKVLKYLARGTYLVLELYDEQGNFVCEIPQNKLSEIFARAPSSQATLLSLCKKQ